MNEKELIKQRFKELSQRSFDKGYPTSTGFLNLDEISLLKSQYYKTEYKLNGGYDSAERCIASFCNNDTFTFPITCIKIEPLQQKFSDKLTHRDFLGSLMNLGIERSTLGDIKIIENVGYLFCLNSISQYIIDELTRIKHTSVKCSIIDEIPIIINQQPDIEEKIVSSLRADAIIASVYKLSRNNTNQLFVQGKVYVNSRQITKEGLQLKEHDTVSVRGYGKFIFEGISSTTKKGRLVVELRIYK